MYSTRYILHIVHGTMYYRSMCTCTRTTPHAQPRWRVGWWTAQVVLSTSTLPSSCANHVRTVCVRGWCLILSVPETYLVYSSTYLLCLAVRVVLAGRVGSRIYPDVRARNSSNFLVKMMRNDVVKCPAYYVLALDYRYVHRTSYLVQGT